MKPTKVHDDYLEMVVDAFEQDWIAKHGSEPVDWKQALRWGWRMCEKRNGITEHENFRMVQEESEERGGGPVGDLHRER